MGLTFKREDNFDEMFDKFAILPDDKTKDAGKASGTDKSKAKQKPDEEKNNEK